MSTEGNITDIRVFKRLLKLTKQYKNLFWASAVMAIILAPLNTLPPYLTNLMVDDYIVKFDKDGLIKITLIYLVVLILNIALRYIFILSTNLLGQNIIRDLRNKVFQHFLHLNVRFFDKTPVGTATTRTINDIETVNSVFTEGMITILADILAVVAILAVMFWTSVRLTLICLVTFPFLIIASYIFKEKVKASFQRVRAEVAKMNAFLQEHISGIRFVQLFTAEDKVRQKFKTINTEYTQANIDSIFYYAVFFPVVELISAMSLGLMVWWGAHGVLQDVVTIGQLVAFPMFLYRLFHPIRLIADKFNTLQMGLVAANRVFSILDTTDTVNNSGTIKQGNLKGDIVFDKVHFSYNEQQEVLKNISFEIKNGETLAIVGSTGSGKTTIIQILNRLYDIDQGEILINNQNIKNYDLQFLRSRIAVVLQDVFLFSGTVLENITLLTPEITEEQVVAIAKRIGAHKLIEQLPGGYHYQLVERGSNLSMGQRQLISFVRALVIDPDILILDEATSSIDPNTESVIQQAIEKLIEGRTSIVIAHRLSTIRHAEKIMVIDNGEIKEFGTRKELLDTELGLFRRMHNMQFQLIEN